ncbi:hypothetical protein Ae201684P_010155 [Aphanomyces euteiches]|uniref:Uncharacterized protein n=1 Tax=Aphanomyces euteiches TaxID=100861 RepID=A0A6G0WZY9_9STRA|nr:hypothetical protein Ae201684_009912 [Aphanomyces euteiches]KAH9095947.1 hypothetical protein Ae201684P_010155 [Aphanomyces euteiches]
MVGVVDGKTDIHIHTNFTPKQVKNKFTALKAEYRSLIAAGMETGNGEDRIKYPDYWGCLLDCMQSHSGLQIAAIADSCHHQNNVELQDDPGNDESDESMPKLISTSSKSIEHGAVGATMEQHQNKTRANLWEIVSSKAWEVWPKP